ncbi:hypothetical protein K461DRAFT_292209 [Myriangium duriaei CBS 260.36]|uniref:C3H1-type domain-containing protein n=1 Tax=Myriangium duriaei CBS 260.36 TaxID=1168546 RepID=A0A9P4MMM0_9PEZI|nr:hypothetical protein K461DRAFT_292209 [Myriangium duriaei CBS 260.36]
MLSENEASAFAKDVVTFRYHTATHAAALQNLLANYEKVLADYKFLLKELDEAKDARDRYKQQVRSIDSHPFILALIDGDAHTFHESLVGRSTSGDGGVVAADLLYAFLLEKVRRLNLAPDTQCVVRYFVNVAGSSTDLHRVQALGSHCRALAPFAAAFSRRQLLFDVVDAGEKPGTTEGKIAENFRLYMNNPCCKHIFFGACNTLAHQSMLDPYQRQANRITLIRNSQSLIQYSSLGLPAEELNGIFREGRISPPERAKGVHGASRRNLAEPSAPPHPPKSGSAQQHARNQSVAEQGSGPNDPVHANKHRQNTREVPLKTSAGARTSPWLQPVIASQHAPLMEVDKAIKTPDKPNILPWPSGDARNQAQQIQPVQPVQLCQHYQKGHCKYGTLCHRRHEGKPLTPESELSVPASNPGASVSVPPVTINRAAKSEDWRRPADASRSRPIWDYRAVEQQQLAEKNLNTRPGTEAATAQSAPAATLLDSDEDFPITSNHSSPSRTATPLATIPLNSGGHRLDPYPGPLIPKDEHTLSDLRARAPPCVEFQLLGTCRDERRCRMDHGYVPLNLKTAMKHQMHRRPCPKGGNCREPRCLLGHVCWEAGCEAENSPHCRLPDEAHGVDTRISHWVMDAGMQPVAAPGDLLDMRDACAESKMPELAEHTEDSTSTRDVSPGPGMPKAESDEEEPTTPRASLLNARRGPIDKVSTGQQLPHVLSPERPISDVLHAGLADVQAEGRHNVTNDTSPKLQPGPLQHQVLPGPPISQGEAMRHIPPDMQSDVRAPRIPFSMPFNRTSIESSMTYGRLSPISWDLDFGIAKKPASSTAPATDTEHESTHTFRPMAAAFVPVTGLYSSRYATMPSPPLPTANAGQNLSSEGPRHALQRDSRQTLDESLDPEHEQEGQPSNLEDKKVSNEGNPGAVSTSLNQNLLGEGTPAGGLDHVVKEQCHSEGDGIVSKLADLAVDGSEVHAPLKV